mgnify:CR=1 FL=1
MSEMTTNVEDSIKIALDAADMATSAASDGGLSRVSATVTCAPWRTHQRAIDSPEMPRPRIRTCWS